MTTHAPGADLATDERALFEAAYLAEFGNPANSGVANGVELAWLTGHGKMWQARAALAAVPASEPVAVGKDEEILSLHRQLAAEKLRADQGWDRYEAANRSRQVTENQLADAPAPVSGIPDLAGLRRQSPTEDGMMEDNPHGNFVHVNDVERLLNPTGEKK